MNYIKKMKEDLANLKISLENAEALVTTLIGEIIDLEKLLEKVKSLG